MLLSPRTEAALFAVLCTGQPSMSDLIYIQNLRAEPSSRANVRHHLDYLSKLQESTR